MAFDTEPSAELWSAAIATGKYRLEIPDELIVRSLNMFKREGVKKILDIGCGLGRHIHLFVERGYPVLGVDVAFSAIQKSRVKVSHYPSAYLVMSDISRLAIRSSQFCLALAWRMLHLNTQAQIETAIGEIHRVLRPNGIVVCSVRSTRNTLFYKARESGREVEPHTYIMENGDIQGMLYHFFTKEEVQKTFSKYFEVSSIEERQLEHTNYTSDLDTGKNWFWIVVGRKKEVTT